VSVKPIETRYKGFRFRSRLEARWAVFFEALGIKWEYEPEGFELSDGTRYLPDFHLPTFGGGMYVEVKPDGGDFSLARKSSFDAETTVWLAEGAPSERAWVCVSLSWEPGEFVGVPNADQAAGENRMFSDPGYENDNLTIPRDCWPALGDVFLNAVAQSRSARFEHGEDGTDTYRHSDGRLVDIQAELRAHPHLSREALLAIMRRMDERAAGTGRRA
jgi:hypothetical protein